MAPYWRTRFGAFVGGYGVERLSLEFQRRGDPVTNSAVYSWIYGRRAPRPQAVDIILAVSHGRVTRDDIRRHQVAVGAQLART